MGNQSENKLSEMHAKITNSMVGRSESVHTQMHAKSPYFGSSGDEGYPLDRIFSHT